MCLLAGSASAQIIIGADVSGRTEGGGSANVDKHDSSKLSVRTSSGGNKSWIKFHLGPIDGRAMGTATLTVSLHEPKTGAQSFQVSYVNDDCLDNINWAERQITWNNAPGNNTADLGLLDPTKTTLLATVNFTDGVIGQSFVIDVLPAIQSDTDGIVQLVLHNSPNLINLSTHDHAIEAQRPVLHLTEMHIGANDPVPDHAASVETSLPTLSWTNPDPNDGASPITCDVYFGADPNRPRMDKVTLPAGASTVNLTAGNFPHFVPLVNNRTYYWVVDAHDPSLAPAETLLPGLMWWFYTDNNNPPVVAAGPDQVVWLGMSGTPGQEVIHLNGTASDDGLPKPPGQYTLHWTQVATGAPTVTITPDNAQAATVTVTARGTYEFTLTADDSARQTEDTVRIIVGDDACDASHVSTGGAYNPADQNGDCIVNLADFAVLFAANWLDCTDTLANCGN
jgi:hypothetical protein